MTKVYNDLFRFVSIRGSQPVYTAEPSLDLADIEVVERLAEVEVDLDRPDPRIPDLLKGVPKWGDPEITKSLLNSVSTQLTGVRTFAQLIKLKLSQAGQTQSSVLEFARSPDFLKEYRALINSWLTLILTERGSPQIPRQEQLLRVGHLLRLALSEPALLREPEAVVALLNAAIVPPGAWLTRGRLVEKLATYHAETLPTLGERIAPSPRRKRIVTAKAQHAALVRRRELAESIQSKFDAAYRIFKRAKYSADSRSLAAEVPQTDNPSSADSPARPPAILRPRVGSPIKLDDDFYKQLDETLTSQERVALKSTLSELKRPQSYADFGAVLAPEGAIAQANVICHRIRLWEEEELTSPPDAPTKQQDTSTMPLVRAVGWGDLVVARERLVGYDAREVSHIENVMPGESKLREHELQKTTETIRETETQEDTESQRDLETTDRYELQNASQSTIQEEYSIQAGLNTSGKYGLTQVDTSVQAGMQQSKSEAKSSAQTLGRDVVSKALERTRKQVRELRRLTTRENIRELNRHGLENIAKTGGAAAVDVSGVYLWLEKLLEVQLRHYGTRLLVEFYIPEPALSLLAQGLIDEEPLRKPAAFTLHPQDVLPENYLCLTAKYGATDVEPPPPSCIQVGYQWASTPNEESDEWGQDARGDMIAIPRDYRPVAMTALVSAHPGFVKYTDIFMAIGGEIVVEMHGTDYGESGQAPGGSPNANGPVEIDFDPSLDWPAGVPVVVRAASHFDNTLTAEATIRCIRKPEALATWQLRTWEQLRAAHSVLEQDYRSELDRRAIEVFRAAGSILPESELRRIEGEELRKWAIKAMRLEPLNFSAVITEDDGIQEIDPLAGDLMATVARFFEESFEWPQASYFLYPYYWARRDTWRMRSALAHADGRHAAFLRAGSARYVVPVTPGYEARVLRYLESDGPESSRLGEPPINYQPKDGLFKNLWLELLIAHRPELSLGSGTLTVEQGSDKVIINVDSSWHASDRDLERELYIDGETYKVKSVAPFQEGVAQELTIDEKFSGTSTDNATYASGSVPYGPPWVERIPTSLVILQGNRKMLTSIV